MKSESSCPPFLSSPHPVRLLLFFPLLSPCSSHIFVVCFLFALPLLPPALRPFRCHSVALLPLLFLCSPVALDVLSPCVRFAFVLRSRCSPVAPSWPYIWPRPFCSFPFLLCRSPAISLLLPLLLSRYSIHTPFMFSVSGRFILRVNNGSRKERAFVEVVRDALSRLEKKRIRTERAEKEGGGAPALPHPVGWVGT